jgi:hypothetical protein
MRWVCGQDGEGKERTQYFGEENFCEGDVKAASPFEGTDRPSGSSVSLGLLVRAFTIFSRRN